jgi:hypothetical protein
MRKAPKQKPRSPTSNRSDRQAKTSPKTKKKGKATAPGAAEIIVVESTLKPLDLFIDLVNAGFPPASTREIISCSNAVLDAIAKTGQIDQTSREWDHICKTAEQRLKVRIGVSVNLVGAEVFRDAKLPVGDVVSDLVSFYLYPSLVKRQATNNGSEKNINSKANCGSEGETLEIYEPFCESDIALLFLDALGKTDTRKIKQCTGCQTIYLSKNIGRIQKYCSIKCKRRATWPPDRWANYISQLREKKKQAVTEEANRNREEEIQRLMKILNLSREEALRTIEDDRKA